MIPPGHSFDDVGRNWLPPDETRWPANLRVATAQQPGHQQNSAQAVLWDIGLVFAVTLAGASGLALCLDLFGIR